MTRLIVASLLLSACAPPAVWRATSPDLAVHVTVQKQKSLACVRVGAAEPNCHEAVSLEGMSLSDRGGSVAYPARVGQRWVVIHDGRAGAEWDGVGTPVLSPTGARVAYPAEGKQGW